MQKLKISFTLNGHPTKVIILPNMTLLTVLRDVLNISSVKAACWQGDCGLCTVLLDGNPVKSCLILAYEITGREIITVEGLTEETRISPLQQAFIDHGAVQCGFCTSAFLLVGTYLLNQGNKLSREEISEAINGILCRCTGYKQIIDAIYECINTQNS